MEFLFTFCSRAARARDQACSRAILVSDIEDMVLLEAIKTFLWEALTDAEGTIN